MEGGEMFLCAVTGPISLLTFPFRATIMAYRMSRRGGRVHLGDCAILPLGLFFRVLFGQRFSVSTNGLDVFYPAWWYQKMVRFCLPYADVVVCSSRRLASEVLARGVAPEAIREIPYGVWPEECVEPTLRQTNSVPHLLTIGRLIPRKGVFWFLTAVFPLLIERYPTLRYSIIGTGTDAARIRSLITERSWEKHVFMRPQEEREQAFAEADLFVMPNIDIPGNGEGLPLVCLEAMARGVPVAASRLDGITDAVKEGVTGRFFSPGSASECVEVIEQLLVDPLDRGRIVAACRESYLWPRLVERYSKEVFAF
jgi:phosphatidylinositol alpha-1,6-mannosyltransferase